MIASLGLLLLTFAAPAVQPTAVSGSAGPANPSETSTASSPSFEQISKSAMEAWNENRSDDAIGFFEQGLKLKPDWDDGLWYLEALFYDKHRFFEARDLLRHYLAQNPKQSQGWAMLGLCEYQLREYGHALDHLRRSISLGLGDRAQLAQTVFYVQAILLTRNGQFDASFRLLGKMRMHYVKYGDAGTGVQDSLEVPVGLSLLGYQLLPEEVPQDRREFVRKMGEACFALLDENHEKAKAIFQELEREHPNEQATHFQYGSVLLEEAMHLDEDMPVGVEEMRTVLALSPFNTAARLLLAKYFMHRAQPEQAKPYLDELLKLEPLNPEAHMLNGEILASAGNTTGAISEFEIARQTTPNESQLLWHLMRAYIAAGRHEDAARIQTELARIHSNAPADK